MQEIVESIDKENRIEVAIGSTSRHRSIANGLQLIRGRDWPQPDVVVIHDGARPMLAECHLKQLVSAALQFGVSDQCFGSGLTQCWLQASGIICKLTSTVLTVTEEHFLERALDRSKLFASETPQAFRYQFIEEAYNQVWVRILLFHTLRMSFSVQKTNTNSTPNALIWFKDIPSQELNW